jgi:hypothetical protein
MTEDEAEELIRLRLEARLFNDALYATMRDYQILEKKLKDAANDAGTWVAVRQGLETFLGTNRR